MSKQLVGVMRLDKRTAKRFETSLQVLFVWQGRVIQATAVDVSMTGMRLTCEIDIELGTELSAHFAPQGGTATYQLEGKIVWSRPSEEIAGIYIAGLNFSVLPHATGEQLAALIRTLGGEVAVDDLPVVDAEELVDTPVAPASGPPRAAAAPDPAAGLFARGPTAEASTPGTAAAEPEFSAVAAPLPGPNATPAAQDPFASPNGPTDEWTITDQLKSAVAEDYRRRQENRDRAEKHLVTARRAKADGDLQSALPLLREAAELVPDSPEIFEELAATVYLTGDVIESAKLFDKALRLRMERGD